MVEEVMVVGRSLIAVATSSGGSCRLDDAPLPLGPRSESSLTDDDDHHLSPPIMSFMPAPLPAGPSSPQGQAHNQPSPFARAFSGDITRVPGTRAQTVRVDVPSSSFPLAGQPLLERPLAEPWL